MQCDDNDKAASPATEGKFTFESAQDVETLVGYLRAITDGFEAGSMRFTRKDLDLVLSPKGLVGFAVEAKGKEGRMKLTLKFHWRENVEAKEPEEDTLTITPGDAR
ncbi:amphi-Trp domain-containing protein [Fundidesulfovibrio agrisoli]|uniref:amphi-Trp domain-containing protein n=1 Tax=Fundidesulfovibrio agrisoli TaxID=2922717 RepID=UPI001FAC67BA|nr:amphi-Trp domain-containing protein [Fundidesulfovibrio agrisoli]